MFRFFSTELKLVLYLIFVFCSLQKSFSHIVNFKAIMNQIKSEIIPHLIIIMHDGRNENRQILDEIVQTTVNEYPTKVINFIQEDPKKLQDSIASRSFSQNTFLVAVLDETTDLNDVVFFIHDLSGKFLRPRCLAISLVSIKSEGQNRILFENVFANAEKRDILHFTVLEIKKERKLGLISVKNQDYRNKTMYYFNPFNNMSFREEYTKELTIFSNKLNDLRQWELNVGTFYKSQSENRFIQSGDEASYRDVYLQPQFNILKFIGKAMNFNVTLVPFMNPSYYEDGMVKEIQQTCTTVHCHPNAKLTYAFLERYTNYVIMTRRERYRIVLVQQKTFIKSPSEIITSFYVGLCSFLFTSFICIIFWFLRIHKMIPQILNYFESRNSVSLDKINFSKKILFITTFLGFLLLSSFVHLMFTNEKIIKTTVEVIDSIEGLQKSNTSILITTALSYLMEENENNFIHSLFDPKRIILTDVDCMKYPINSSLVACLVEEKKAENTVLKKLFKHEYPKLKILKDFNIDLQLAFNCKVGLPIVFEFQRYMQIIEEYGLMNKWNKDFSRLRGMKEEERIVSLDEENQFLFRSFFVLGMGLGLSIIVFLGEIWLKGRQTRKRYLYIFNLWILSLFKLNKNI